MSDAREKVAASIKTAVGLASLPAHKRADAEADAFEALRTALVAAKKDEGALTGFSEDELVQVLDLIVRRAAQKKMLRGRAKECLGIGLADGSWLRAAQRDAELLAGLRDLAADSPPLLDRLSAEPPSPDALEAAKRRSSAALAVPDAEVAEAKADIEQKLLSGRAIMAKFGFRFPMDHVSSKLDEATDGFSRVFEAVTRLSTTAGKAGPDCAALEALRSFTAQDFENMLTFLQTMYESGVRNTYRARVKFVIDKLKELSPTFQEVSDKPVWGELSTGIVDDGAPFGPPVKTLTPAAAATPVQPIVVWIDYKKEAYATSRLAKSAELHLEGFHDDDKAAGFRPAAECLRYVRARTEDQSMRVDAVVLNRKHLEMVPEVVKFCKAAGRRAPRFVVVSRSPAAVAVDMKALGAEDGRVVSRWDEAADIAAQEVASRQREAAAACR